MTEKNKNYDFFISYNHIDEDFATWIAWILEEAGYKVFIQAWDFGSGNNFILEMQRGASFAHHTLALLSENYLKSSYTQPEWAAAFGTDPTGTKRKLIPVRIQDIELEGLLPQIIHIDLVNKNEDSAKKAILEGVSLERKKPLTAPPFPGIIPRTKPEKRVEIEAPSNWYEPWLKVRIDELEKGRFANNILDGAKLVLHLIPLESIGGSQFEIKDLKRPAELQPFYATGWDYTVNKDGYNTFAKWPNYETSHSYVQFFRNGIIESVDMGMLQAHNDKKFIPFIKFENDIINFVSQHYFNALKAINIKLPIAICISLLDIKDYFISGDPRFPREYIKENLLTLPVVIVNTWETDIRKGLKSAFDYLWNHCGFEGSLNYDENGNWARNSGRGI